MSITEKWIKKMWSATWMDLEVIILNEISQRQIYHLYVESKKMIQMNLQNGNRRDSENKLIVTKEERWRKDKPGVWD